MNVITLAGTPNVKNSGIILARLKARLKGVAPKSFGAHIILNEINRLTGVKTVQKPGPQLNNYRNYLTEKLKLYHGSGIIPSLVKREIALIDSNKFTGTTAGSINGIGAKKKKGFFKKLGKGLKKFGKFQKKLALAPARHAALSLIILNFRGLASKLSRADKNKVAKKWTRLGGSAKSLFKTIKSGAKKKPLLGGKKHAKKPVKGLAGLNTDLMVEIPAINGGIGVVQLAAVIALATPIIAALASIVGKGKGSGSGAEAGLAAEEGGSLEDIVTTAQETASAAGAPTELPPGGDFKVTDKDSGAEEGAGDPTGDEEIDAKNAPGFSFTPSPIMIGAAVIGAYLLLNKKR